jgi:hypothetical protein
MSDHPRDIMPMQTAPRCGAKARSGAPCGSPAIAGKARCRMHGGKGSGAPMGNRNALRKGLYTKEVLAWEERLRSVRRRLTATISTIEGKPKRSRADKI